MREIVVYTQKDCPNCEALAEQLELKKIPYKKVIIDNDYKIRARMIAAGCDSVPVLGNGDMFIKGSIETLVESAMYLSDPMGS